MNGEAAMSPRDVDTTASRLSWGILVCAFSAMAAWALRQIKARGSESRLTPGAHPAVAKGAGKATIVQSDSAAPAALASHRRASATDTDVGSTLSQLRAEFSRFPPKELAQKIWAKISDHEVTTLSTSFAYYWVFAIPPLLILIVMIAALINRATDVQVVENLRDLLNDRAPANTRPLLRELVDNAVAKVGGNTASFGAILTAGLALWSGSNAVQILIKGFNRAYDVEESRPFVRLKLLTVGLTLVLVLFVNLAFALLVFGRQLGEWIAGKFGLGSAFDFTWMIARWPIAILGIMLLGAVLYWAGPNVEQPFRWVSLGSAVATVLWLLLVAGFGLYLLVADPASAFGAVGSVIVLLLFLNFSGIIFFLGAEVSAIIYRAAEADSSSAPVG